MARPDPVLARLRKICLALPETRETITWGKPHFRVGEKIFAGYGEEKGTPTISYKLEKKHADSIVEVPGFSPAPYVGHKGWVSMDARAVRDWDHVKALIHESYRLIAPRRLAAELDAEPGPAARKSSARRPRRR